MFVSLDRLAHNPGQSCCSSDTPWARGSADTLEIDHTGFDMKIWQQKSKNFWWEPWALSFFFFLDLFEVDDLCVQTSGNLDVFFVCFFETEGNRYHTQFDPIEIPGFLD